MSEKGKNIALSSYDDIFKDSETRQMEEQLAEKEVVQEIDLLELHPFKKHPFQVRVDEEMMKTVESIVEYGVLTPAIVRPRKQGGYEIISGHRRAKAADMAGLYSLPCIVRNLDDDAATILMVDANLQRENILPSERAWAFRMKLEALNRTMGRPKNVGQVVPDYQGKRSTEVVAEGTGESYKQVQRYIRLTYLLPQLLDMVDEKKMGFIPAVELSFLSPEKQNDVLNAMDYAQCTPSLSQAQRIRQLAKSKDYSLDKVEEIMNEEKKPEIDHVTIKHDVIRKYFPKSYTPKQMEDTIIKLLDQWQKKRNRDMNSL